MRQSIEERTQRTLRRMIPGGFSGRTEQVSPVRPPSSQLQTYRPTVVKATLTFAGGPGLAVSTSGSDHLRDSYTLFSVVLLHSLAPSANTTVNVWKNGAPINPVGSGSPNLVLGPGSADPKRISFDFSVAYIGSDDPTLADIAQVDATTVDGTAAQNLTVKLLFG